MSAQAETTQSSLEREWWLRLGLVFTEPRTVFAWLRDDTDAAAHARQEPVLLVGFLAACAGVLTSNGISHEKGAFTGERAPSVTLSLGSDCRPSI